MARSIRAVALLAVTAWSGAARAEDDARQQHYAQLQQLMIAHRNAEAVALADTIIVETEQSLKGEKRQVYSGQSLTSTLMNMGNAAAGRRDAVDIGPAYGFALFAKGFALEDMDRADEAGAFLDRAVAVSPFTAQYLCEAGYWHAHHRDSAGGLALYQRCAAMSGLAAEDNRARWNAAALRGQGYALIDLGRLDEAESAYRESLKIEPDNVHAQNDLRFIVGKRYGAAQPH